MRARTDIHIDVRQGDLVIVHTHRWTTESGSECAAVHLDGFAIVGESPEHIAEQLRALAELVEETEFRDNRVLVTS